MWTVILSQYFSLSFLVQSCFYGLLSETWGSPGLDVGYFQGTVLDTLAGLARMTQTRT